MYIFLIQFLHYDTDIASIIALVFMFIQIIVTHAVKMTHGWNWYVIAVDILQLMVKNWQSLVKLCPFDLCGTYIEKYEIEKSAFEVWGL